MGEWGVGGDQDCDMDAAVWANGESECGCPRGSVWVEGPVVIGLYGLLPTEAVAHELREGASARESCAAEGAGAAGGATGAREAVDVGVQESAYTVEEEASVLRELVFCYLRGGGDLVGECQSAGAPIPTPAILLARDLSSWQTSADREGTGSLDRAGDTSTWRACAPQPHVLVQEWQPDEIFVLSPWRLRRCLVHARTRESSRDGADAEAICPVVTWCVSCNCPRVCGCVCVCVRACLRACMHHHVCVRIRNVD